MTDKELIELCKTLWITNGLDLDKPVTKEIAVLLVWKLVKLLVEKKVI